MDTITIETEVDAPPPAVWQVLDDFGNIDRWAPGVRRSVLEWGRQDLTRAAPEKEAPGPGPGLHMDGPWRGSASCGCNSTRAVRSHLPS